MCAMMAVDLGWGRLLPKCKDANQNAITGHFFAYPLFQSLRDSQDRRIQELARRFMSFVAKGRRA
jgi:hypothetical protein